MYKRARRKNLSFTGERLTRGRHKIHPYPAMLHPLLVNFLIREYAKGGDTIFDPFCGSGVTLLQSSVNGYRSIGFDINPLALLIAKTKTQRYSREGLLRELQDLREVISKNKRVDIPSIKNVDYWYSKDVINNLGRIRASLKDKKYKYENFFATCFAFICRNQSFTRNSEFKRYRIEANKIAIIENRVFDKFFEHAQEMADIFTSIDLPKQPSNPLLANSENPISPKIKYDLVITSPPYGDSRTTVAYGEYSSFGLEWTKGLNPYGEVNYRIDREGLGKISRLNEELAGHKNLISIIEKIRLIDKKRADEVLYFFNGYYSAIKNITNNLKPRGRVCFVVGNRIVKGYQIPMDQITASFLKNLGLDYESIFVRDILNKVMPSQNSPSNKAGVKSQTMMNEYIVVFSKK